MSVSSSRYPLIRISKTGEMRLKNKVGNAILKENAYEDRALNTRLDTLSKHQFRQDKYMTYRQLEFATKQVSASEERPRTLSDRRESKHAQVSELPPIDARRRSLNIVATNLAETNRSNQGGEVVAGGKNRAKGRWEKAITLVRLAVQNRPSKEASANPLAGHRKKIPATQPPASEDLDLNQLPPIHANEGTLREPVASSKKKPALRKMPSVPEMLKLSREKTQKCLEDPRFMKLEQCLSETKSVREAKQHRRNTRTKRVSPNKIRYTR